MSQFQDHLMTSHKSTEKAYGMKGQITKVELRALAVFNISDHFSRHRWEDEVGLGILLGTIHDKGVIADTSFQLLHNNDIDIDMHFMKARIHEFQIIDKDKVPVGFYLISRKPLSEPTISNMRRKLEDTTRKALYGSNICVIVEQYHTAGPDNKFFKAFSLHETLGEISLRMVASDTEYVASSTAARHSSTNISTNSKKKKSDQMYEERSFGMSASLRQLTAKTSIIIQYCNNKLKYPSATDSPSTEELSHIICHLSRVTSSFRRSCQADSVSSARKLQASHLHSLTLQLAALEDLKYQIIRNVFQYGIHSSNFSLE